MDKVVELLNSKEVRDMEKKRRERKNNKIVDSLITKQTERKARIDHQKYLAHIRAENKWNAIPSSYESNYFEEDAVDIIVYYDLLPKSIKPKNFVAGKDMSPEGEIVYGHLSPSEESTIYRRLKKAGVPENAITIYNC